MKPLGPMYRSVFRSSGEPMGRKRTVNQDLPANTSRDRRTNVLRYRRPDNARQLYFSGMPEEIALRVIEVINNAFGHRPARGMRHVYRMQFRAFAWSNVDPEILRVIAGRMSDILPMQRGLEPQEEIRHSWAFTPPPASAMRHGLKPLREARDWIKPLYLAARKNAAARKLSFDLSIEDVERLVAASKGRCGVTGIALSIDRGQLPVGRKIRRPWAPSLDRIDSASGYSATNCRIVCCAANYAMSQWGEDVLIEMAKAIARKRIRRIIG